MKKKKLYFIIESLTCAGAEKSLVTLLSLIDYSKFEVDLQLLSYGGEFEVYLPEQVNLLPPLEYTAFLDSDLSKQLLSLDLKKIIARLSYSISLRKKGLTHADRARLFWKYVAKCFPVCKMQYDIAIGYSHGIPTFYVVDKVQAKKKIAWINATYNIEGKNKNYQERFYKALDHIVLVSSSAFDVFREVYPAYRSKMLIIMDLIDASFIEKMARLPKEYKIRKDLPILLTVARLNNRHKGYDIAIEAAKILHDRGIKFRWYAIGKGDYRNEMVDFIRINNMQDTFILLGTTPNPYPYIKDCTIYVQTSRHEGFGLSIAEARILNRPVITTDFDAVYCQMVQGKNGIVVSQDPTAVADAIEKMLGDKELQNSISAYQMKEKKGNSEELCKFYELIESLNG